MGLTTGGAIGAQTALKLDDCLRASTPGPRRRSRSIREMLVLCHGGPIAEPEDAAYIMNNARKLPRLLRRLLDGAAAGRARR